MKTSCSHVHILSKNINSLKNTVLSYHFFQFCHEKPPPVIPIFSHKKSKFCENYTIFGPKKSIGCHFFPIFLVKITSLMPIFCKKNVHSLKTYHSHAPILSKKCPFSQNTVLHVICINFFMRKPLLSCPYLVKNASILPKLHYIMG